MPRPPGPFTPLSCTHRDEVEPTAPTIARHLTNWAPGTPSGEAPSWQRESRAALGLVSRQDGGQREYLFRYNRKWQRWNFVAGHFEPDQDRDFADTMIREFIEETGGEIGEAPVVYGRDFTIKPLTTTPLEGVCFSGSAQQWTKYEFHVFWILLHGDLTVWDARWQRHPALFRWLGKTELEREVARDSQTLVTPFPLGVLLAIM